MRKQVLQLPNELNVVGLHGQAIGKIVVAKLSYADKSSRIGYGFESNGTKVGPITLGLIRDAINKADELAGFEPVDFEK